MSGHDPRSPLRSLPWGLLGMFALVLAFEAFAAAHQNNLFLKIDAWTWKQTGRRAERPGSKARIVCLGDSLVQVGVASPIIEKHAGLSTCNLAISGGQAASSYFLLRRVLEAGGRPDSLVLDFFPRHLQSSPLVGLDPWIDLTTFAEVVDLARAGRDAEFLGRVALAKILPTVRSRPEIRGTILAALNGEDRSDRHHVPPSLRRNIEVNRGGLLCPSTPTRHEDLEAWSKTYFPTNWSCHPVNDVYVRRLLALAASRGIRVFWLLPPIQPVLQQRCERNGFDARHLDFVRGFQAEFPNVTVLDGRHANYDPDVFFDPHHLARDGAAVFSFDVAMTLRRSIHSDRALPRWVDLPSYGKRRIDGPLEDVEQSRVAAKLERAKRVH
ncbi:hypothetical protein [Singulisphaera acidiphila]|uniref:Uncharacterized protein n=1 Tax=Singulisphaera acidiphila (strain ATCC BAA-1392 / DSM 18658 / VKM B-2454 / MOB10) TaxID=886293 RepID=L0DC39_SINAD|nr:hypothetical protein [Singulisphaera acidiphila]AGA26241.1 hypothetical protein Sinac_1879 [Singulisphaera acidiphila DSM 18658]